MDFHISAQDDIAARRARFNSMFDRVLYQRDQHQGRKLVATQRFGYFYGIPQAMPHPDLHYRQIARANIKLLSQRRMGTPDFRAEPWHRSPEMIDQSLNRGLSAGRFGPDE